jgi:hypothetical protein
MLFAHVVEVPMSRRKFPPLHPKFREGDLDLPIQVSHHAIRAAHEESAGKPTVSRISSSYLQGKASCTRWIRVLVFASQGLVGLKAKAAPKGVK